LAGVTGLEPATSAVTAGRIDLTIRKLCCRYHPGYHPPMAEAIAASSAAKHRREDFSGGCCGHYLTKSRSQRGCLENAPQPLLERTMTAIQDGISVERKTDGTVVLTISGNLFRPDEQRVERASLNNTPTPPARQTDVEALRSVVLEAVEKKSAQAAVRHKNYLTIREVSEMLRLSQRCVWRLIAGRDLPHHRIGRTVRFREDEIETWLEKQSGRR
jgi:excisionase family DNA binding protein